MEILGRLRIEQLVHLLEGRAVKRQALRKRPVLEREQVHIAEVLHQGHAVARPLVDDFRDAEFRLTEEISDRDELFVVFALLGPVDADERLAHRGFDPHDGATGRTALDRLQRDGHGGVHSEKLSGGGKDRFGWHGRRQTRVEKTRPAKGKSVVSLMMIKPQQHQQSHAGAP